MDVITQIPSKNCVRRQISCYRSKWKLYWNIDINGLEYCSLSTDPRHSNGPEYCGLAQSHECFEPTAVPRRPCLRRWYLHPDWATLRNRSLEGVSAGRSSLPLTTLKVCLLSVTVFAADIRTYAIGPRHHRCEQPLDTYHELAVPFKVADMYFRCE